MAEEKNGASQEEQKNGGDQSKESTGSARNVLYAAIIILAIVIVAWTVYAQLLFKKANTLSLEGKNDEAAKILKRLRSTSFGFQVNRKELSKVYLDLARGFMGQDPPDNARAKELCRDAVRLSEDPEVLLDAIRAIMALPEPDYTLCEELGQKLTDPSKKKEVRANAHRELSSIYHEQRRYEDAVKQLDKYLELKPDDKTQRKLRKAYASLSTHQKASDMLNEGVKLQEQGKLDEAIASYEETAKKYPQFRFIARQTVKAYLEKYASLSVEAKKSEGDNLLNSALGVLDASSVRDNKLRALLGNNEELKKKKAGYKLTAVSARMGDLDKALEECKKYAAENPDDKVDDLLKAVQTAIEVRNRDEQRMGGGRPPAQGGAGAGVMERFKHTIELVQLVRKLPKLDENAEVAISAGQTVKILPVLKEIERAEKMPQKDAEAKVTAIKDILSEAQLAAIEKIKLPRRGGGGRGAGGGPPNAAMPGGPGGGPGGPGAGAAGGRRDPDANPFKSQRRKGALTELIQLLEKKAPKEK